MANPPIFYTEKKKMRTVRQVRQKIEEIFQDKIERFTVLPKSLKVWLDKQPKERKSKKSSVVVEAPILKLESGKTTASLNGAPPPMPKVVESFELAKILPGEGVNLDDEEALRTLNRPVLKMQAASGRSDAVSADLLPVIKTGYQTGGITALEAETGSVVRPVYTADQATFFETDEYLIQAPLPVLMTASLAAAEPFDQLKKEIR